MNLRKWLGSLEPEARRKALSDIARECEVTLAAVRHWRNGQRRVPAEQCAAIERATSGAVTAADLRPEIFAKAA